MKKWCIGVAAAALLAQGCSTNLKVVPLAEKTGTSTHGAQYSLPFSRYKISVARVLKKCGGSVTEPQLDFDVSVTATQLFEPDPTQTFVIDTSSLSHWLKTSELSWELYENGMLKTVGAASEDMTAQVISSAVSTALTIAKTAIGAFDLSPCNPDTVTNLKEVARIKGVLETVTETVALEAARLKAMADATAPFGAAPSNPIQNQLVAQARLVAGHQFEMNKATEELKEALKAVTAVDTFLWPDNGATFNDTKSLSSGRLAGWVAQDAKVDAGMVTFAIVPLHALGSTAPPPAPGKDLEGIRYRVPVPGTLEVALCASASAKPHFKCPAGRALNKRIADGPVPQLGRLFSIPFYNGPFQSNTLNLAFNKDGTMTSGKYAEKAARAQVAADSINQTAGALFQGFKDIKELKLTKSQKELNDIKAQTELLKAKKDLQGATAALQPSSNQANDEEMAILASDTALLNAQRAKIDAQTALDAAKKKAQGDQ